MAPTFQSPRYYPPQLIFLLHVVDRHIWKANKNYIYKAIREKNIKYLRNSHSSGNNSATISPIFTHGKWYWFASQQPKYTKNWWDMEYYTVINCNRNMSADIYSDLKYRWWPNNTWSVDPRITTEYYWIWIQGDMYYEGGVGFHTEKIE